MSFAVVEFLGSDDDESSNEVSVVPIIWLTKQERRCHWPNRIGKTKFVDFVKAKSPSKSTWPTYKVFKVHFKTENYEEADDFIHDMLRELNEESAISGGTAKNLSRKKIVIENNSIENHKAHEFAQETQPNSDVSLASTITITRSETPLSSIASSTQTTFQEKVLQVLMKLEVQMDQQTIVLGEILRNSRNQLNARGHQLVMPDNTPNFPIEDLDMFKNFDQRVKQDEALSRYMILRLSSVGGSGIESHTRRMLKFMMTDYVASHYNWKGHFDKNPFESTAVKGLIIDAAKSNYPANEQSDFVIANAIKEWLKYAPSRNKNKKNN